MRTDFIYVKLKKLIHNIAGLFLIAFFLQPSILEAQEVIFFEKPFVKAIWAHEKDTGAEWIHYEIPDKYYSFGAWKVAPITNLLAISVYRHVTGDLLIISAKGKLIKTIINVPPFSYTWSPDGTKLVFGTGKGGDPPYTSFNSLRIIDLNNLDIQEEVFFMPMRGKNQRKTIREPIDNIWDLNWATFDNNIYLFGHLIEASEASGHFVYKIEPDNNYNISETHLKGIHFSPNGNYYFYPGYEGSGFKIFIREKNEDITEKIKTKLLASGKTLKVFSGDNWYVNKAYWFSEDSIVLSWEGKNIIFSLLDNRVKKTFAGRILSIDTEKKKVYFDRDGRIESEQIIE